MALERDDQGRLIIRLDGTMGYGPLARVTIITLDKVHGTKEETFEFPYSLVKFETLQQLTDATFILGYRVEKVMPPDEEVQ